MHVFRLPTFLVTLCSLAFVACIEPPPASQTDLETPNNVVTSDTGNNISEGDMGTDVETEPASCEDRELNQDETDVDCGGILCDPCDLQKTCLTSDDCRSGLCNGVCQVRNECLVGEELTLNDAYTDITCTVIIIPGGTYELEHTINRDVTLQGTGDDVFLRALTMDIGNVTIKNVAFESQSNGDTGAIHQTGGSLILDHVSFNASTATHGGAIWTSGKLTVNDSTFDTNTALRGGAIYGSLGSSLLIQNSMFRQNRASGAGFEGGAIWVEGGSLAITNSSFIGNEAKVEGQTVGIARGGAIFAIPTTMSITSSTFENNHVIGVDQALGGAIWVRGGTVLIEESVFRTNYANAPIAYGGAIAQNNSTTTIRSSAFVQNSLQNCQTACAGGAVRGIATALEDPTLFFENVTFSGHVMPNTDGGSKGAALYIDEHRVKLHSVTFAYNQSESVKNVEPINLSCKSVHLDNSLFADITEPLFGLNVEQTGQNISTIEVNNDNADVLTFLNPPPTLLDLSEVNGTWVHPVESGGQILTNTCKNLEDQPLAVDQASYPRPSGSCIVGAYQGSTP